jgi:hypothetical protein
MLVFPLSFLLLPVVVGLGVGYVFAGRAAGRGARIAIRAGIVATTFAVPLLTQGPGPAQLILGLLVGYLGIRMVALSRRRAAAWDARQVKALVLDLITPTGVFRAAVAPMRRPLLVALGGGAGIAACVVLLVLGNAWRLWQTSRLGHFLDDQLVVLEVAVGVAGVHALIVGVAGLLGRSVGGLLDQPFLSTSLTEFWGRRWNRMVQSNLAAGFFTPLARRGLPTLGLFAAFAASGLFHAVALLGAGPLRVVALPFACVLWAFLGHGFAVFVEQRLGWHHRPVGRSAQAMARVRTLLLFLALSPGLIEPLAAVAGVHGRSLAPPSAQADAPAPGRGCNVQPPAALSPLLPVASSPSTAP